MMINSILHLKNLTKSYQQGDQELKILNGVTFSLKPGELVALVGPSGAGKTTLLQIAGLLDQPSSGEIIINGIECSKADDTKRTLLRRQTMGFVYQFHHLLPEFTALENVMIPLIISGASHKDAKEKAIKLLDEVKLSHRLNHQPKKLSGGEQQRVAIARALSNNPKLLLADEPTGNLDNDTGNIVFSQLLTMVRKNNLSALIATHNMDLAKRMDRIVQLDHGQLKEET